jgi:hypothetical protein
LSEDWGGVGHKAEAFESNAMDREAASVHFDMAQQIANRPRACFLAGMDLAWEKHQEHVCRVCAVPVPWPKDIFLSACPRPVQTVMLWAQGGRLEGHLNKQALPSNVQGLALHLGRPHIRTYSLARFPFSCSRCLACPRRPVCLPRDKGSRGRRVCPERERLHVQILGLCVLAFGPY